MAQNQDEETRGEDSKRKEIAGIRRPPLSFLSIFKEYSIPLPACRDELCQKLYAGVFLKPNHQRKYFVDKTSNKNCFMLFARELSIIHSGTPDYWQWTKEKESSGEDIEVAELLKVSWLDISGTIRTIHLSPGTWYEIVFIVRKKRMRWNFHVDLIIRPQHSKALKRSESLEGKPSQDWFAIQVGEFQMLPEYVGNMKFSLEQHDGNWKRGLVVKCAIIRPKEKNLKCHWAFMLDRK